MRLWVGGVMHSETARRGRLLYIALGFLGLDVPPAAMPPGLGALHDWLDAWHGIGLIEHGMARQARDIALTRYRDRWGVSVFVTGMEHSIVQGTGRTCRLGSRFPKREAGHLLLRRLRLGQAAQEEAGEGKVGRVEQHSDHQGNSPIEDHVLDGERALAPEAEIDE